MAGAIGVDHVRIDEVGDYDVHFRVVPPGLAEDALQAADALAAGVVRVLVVVDGELDEEQVHRPLVEHVVSSRNAPVVEQVDAMPAAVKTNFVLGNRRLRIAQTMGR